VKLELVSGELSLTTQGILQEAGSVGDHVRVLTVKTKREITGIVKNDHSVEVNL
jgi:flagella basal body P-ring formation protein FlgA